MTEKRRSSRLSILMNVMVVVRGVGRVPCLMKDICSSGALLELGEAEGTALPAFSKGDTLRLSMQLGSGEGAREHQLDARIARIRERQLGVAFFRPDPATLKLLMARAAPPEAPAPKALSGDASRILGELAGHVQAYCAERVDEYVKRVEQELISTADSARNNIDQTQLYDAMTQLRTQREQVRGRFLDELQTRMSSDASRNWVDRIPPGGLSLVSKEQLEDWLVVKIMSNTIEASCHEELYGLRQRLQELTGREAGRSSLFAPAMFCDAFQAVVSSLGLMPQAQRILYKTFEATVLAGINELYVQLNQMLVQRGVLPVLPTAISRPAPTPPVHSKANGQRRPPAGRARAPARSNADWDAADEDYSDDDAGDEDYGMPVATRPPVGAGSVVGALRRLLGPGGGNGHARPAAAGVSAVAVDDVRQFFPQLKQAQGDWRQRLEELSSSAGRELDGTVQASLQMAAGLLQNLAQNPQLGDNAKSWFARLELALLNVLMADEDLLEQADNPARQVLNFLARLGYKGYPLTREQERSVNKLVERISEEFDTNTGIFDQAREQLAPYVARQDKVFQHNLDRVVKVAEGEYRREAARRTVLQKIDTLLAGKEVPKALLALLETGWRDHLIQIGLRKGTASIEWERNFRVLEQLLDLDTARQDSAPLISQLESGLLDITGGGSAEQEHTLSAIKTLLTNPAASVERVAVAVTAAAAEGPAPDKGVDRAYRLETGDWLETGSGSPEAQRMRLAWHADDASRHVFVNHQGLKVADLNLAQLAELLQKDDTLVQSGQETPVVDGALQGVVHGLYDRQAWRETHDELTGLLNRHEFTRRLDRAVDSASRNGRQHVLACVNIDQFKMANTASGFAAGDQFLREIAELLGRTLPSKSTLARLGGDKFALIMEDCSIDAARDMLHKRLLELAERHFDSNGRTYHLTASAGLVVVAGDDNPARILGMAEEACALARAEGGNRIHLLRNEGSGLERKEHVMAWVARLSQPLDPRHIRLRCQRIQAIDPELRREELPHYEILLGLGEADAPDQSPGEFLEVASRYHRMLQVDRWVVDTALQWFADNHDKLAGLSMMSVNLSGHSLSDMPMMNYLLSRLMAADFPLEKLCFEVTEQLAIENLADTADFMRELKKLGCRFALDDFGVGHATYHYIKHLPLDYIKIDGSFVREIDKNQNDYVMVRSINDLAHYMGIKTIAEYVENDEVLAKLSELGVDYAQGYGIERPRWLSSI
jgi:diguanylate cyclase (GGDEF)-like protein